MLFALVYRIFHSVELTDEAYGIAEIYNYSFDKKPFINVWDPHTGWFLYVPFINIFRLMSPNLQGVVLYFRIVYLVSAIIIGYMTYRLDRKKIPFISVLGCLGYVPFSIPQMGYNAIISYLLILSFGFLCAFKTRMKEHYCLFIGMTIGVVCLLYPTMSVFALLFAPAVWKQSDEKRSRAIILYTLGVVAVGSAFFLWLITGASGIEKIVNGFKATISTPHELNKGVIDVNFLKQTFSDRLTIFFSETRIFIWSIHCISLLFIMHCSRKSSLEKAKQGLIEWIAFVLLASTQIILDDSVLLISRGGYFCFTVLLSTILFIIFQWGHIQTLSCFPVGMAVVWILIYCFTSDNKNIFFGLDAAGNIVMFSACFAASTMTISGKNKQKLFDIRFGIPAVTLLFSIICFYGYIYRDAPMKELRSRVNTGVYMGLYTTEKNARYVESLEEELDDIIEEHETLFVANNMPSIYLMAKAKPLCPQTWDIQYLARGYTSSSPVLSYFGFIKQMPDVIVADNHLYATLFENEKIEIWSFINQNYDEIALLDFGENGITKIWRLKQE